MSKPADSTVNRPLAIVSSFYTYVLRQGLVRGLHPLRRLELRLVQPYALARALGLAELAVRLAAIPQETPDGLRDDTLLVLALHTGRRAKELAVTGRYHAPPCQ